MHEISQECTWIKKKKKCSKLTEQGMQKYQHEIKINKLKQDLLIDDNLINNKEKKALAPN